MFAQSVCRAGRLFSTSVSRASHASGGYAGSNLPFDIHNKAKLTVYFVLFFGSGMAIPFLAVRHHLVK